VICEHLYLLPYSKTWLTIWSHYHLPSFNIYSYCIWLLIVNINSNDHHYHHCCCLLCNYITLSVLLHHTQYVITSHSVSYYITPSMLLHRTQYVVIYYHFKFTIHFLVINDLAEICFCLFHNLCWFSSNPYFSHLSHWITKTIRNFT